jgi:hypothetical protein
MKTFKIEVIINEGSDEYWEELRSNNKTGCDEVTQVVKESILDVFPVDTEVRLIDYKDK